MRNKRNEHHHSSRWLLIVILLIVVVGFLAYYTSPQIMAWQNYYPLQNGINLGQFCITTQHQKSFDSRNFTWYVHIVQYDQYGNLSPLQVYRLEGRDIRVQGNIVTTDSFNGGYYKLTLIEGYYPDPQEEKKYTHNAVTLNSDDDFVFKVAATLATFTSVRTLNAPLTLNVSGGNTYVLSITKNVLHMVRATNPTITCNNS